MKSCALVCNMLPLAQKLQTSSDAARRAGSSNVLHCTGKAYAPSKERKSPRLGKVQSKSRVQTLQHALLTKASLQLCYLAKAGWVWKRAKVTRQWLRRWATVRKGILRYCEGPGMVSVCVDFTLLHDLHMHTLASQISPGHSCGGVAHCCMNSQSLRYMFQLAASQPKVSS